MDYSINAGTSIKEALGILENNDSQTLFVTDAEGRMLGTLTDGDIRRGMIAGKGLDDSVSSVMCSSFRYVRKDDIDVALLKACRDLRIYIIPVLDAGGRVDGVIDLKALKSMLPIDAVLMAGGKGERLRPLTEHVPKPLLQVGGKAIIDHNIERLLDYGVKNVSVTVNYLAGMIEEHFAEPVRGVRIRCVREPEFLGTIGSLGFVDGFCNDSILVLNSDLFTNIDYESFYLLFRESGADLAVATIPYDVSIPYGILEVEDGKVKGIKEKPVYSHYANAGIYLLRREVLALIPKGEYLDATELINRLCRAGRKVVHYPVDSTWIDIGSFEEYRKAEEAASRLKKR